MFRSQKRRATSFNALTAAVAFVWLALVDGSNRTVHGLISKSIQSNGSVVRIHYAYTDSICRHNIAILAVGTAMKTNDYDLLARSAVRESEHDIVVAILDFNPHDPMKRSSKAFVQAVDNLMNQTLRTIVPLCQEQLNIIVGGHSAGGASAMEAVVRDMFVGTKVAGFIGLDPYSVSPTGGPIIKVPALHWGFTMTTCGVNVHNAAKAAYDRSSVGFRIFYQLSGPYSHCCFTDVGCMSICSCSKCNGDLLHDIGVSVDQFVSAIVRRHRFDRNHFTTKEFWLDPSEFRCFVDVDGISLAS